ncbi:hypothetical protein NIES4103_42340 [Nostoc sp. NIES-4103]|nr:hypothetical protein NIES4103_42340 [Nostoc sp. NIES-4103]
MKFIETLSMPSDLDGFILPNINILKESTNNILTIAGTFKTHFMPDIQLRCKRLSSLIPELSSTIQNYNVQIIAELDNQIIDSYLDTIQEILAELQNPDISQEYRQLLLKAEQEKINLLISELINIRISCETKESILSRQLFDIRNTLIKERLVDVIAEKERQKEKIINAIAQKENKKQELTEEKETLINSLDIMKEVKLLDIFKDRLPTDQYIDKLDLIQPEKVALKEGIHIYKKIFKKLNTGLQYVKLTEYIDELKNKINNIEEDIRINNRTLQEFEDQLSDTLKMLSISDERSIYVEEVEKIVRSLRFFYSKLDSFSEIQATVYTEIKQLLAEMLNYLNQIVVL